MVISLPAISEKILKEIMFTCEIGHDLSWKIRNNFSTDMQRYWSDFACAMVIVAYFKHLFLILPA